MDPTTDNSDSLAWITTYLTVHSLSVPSRRYSFILWLAVVLSFLTFAVLHWTGSTGGQHAAIWSKWALRRRTWRKKHAIAAAKRSNHRQPISLPPNAQLLALFVLTLASLALTFVGPDYLAPTLKVWMINDHVSPPSPSYDTSVPQHTISKSFWSSSARVGQIAFALLPLCVLFALKAPPFALFAIPFMIQLYFDKLAWLHRWAGRLIWLLVCIHVVLWSVQLAKDVNPSTGRAAYFYAWSYTPFIYGWIAFILLTLIILLSLHPFRRRFYEWFYFLHVLLGPCMLVMAGLHHPAVAYWCWAALSLWFGERVWRGTWWIYSNGILSRVAPTSSLPSYDLKDSTWDALEMARVHHSHVDSTSTQLSMDRLPSPLNDFYLNEPISPDSDTSTSRVPSRASSPLFRMCFPPSYIPPSGYVHAELLSGRTMRLRIITPGFLPWSPGQHFLLNIPSVSRLTSHPFTCASVCDEQAPTDDGRIMMFLVRVKSGWTRTLWDLVSRLKADQSMGDASTGSSPNHGVLLRAYIDGPFGSAKRMRWGNYSTAVIITGGSGVSFGLSLLQYMCMCLAGRDGRHLGGRPGGWGWKGKELRRVRFIWLIREYSHIQWCASVIRWCSSIVPLSALQVDIFVTNFKPIPPTHLPLLAPPRAHISPVFNKFCEELQPPNPNFVREGLVHHRSASSESLDSHDSQESDADLGYYLGEGPDNEPPPDEMHIAHESNILDLTNFDGDVDTTLPGEARFCRKLKEEGKLRRLRSRKLSTAEKVTRDTRLSQPLRHAKDSLPIPDQYAARSSAPRGKLTLSIQSTDRLLPISPLSERPSSASSETDFHSPLSYRSEPSHYVYSPRSSTHSSSDVLSTLRLVSADSSRSTIYPPKSDHELDSEPGKPHVVQPLTTNAHLSESHSGTMSTPTSSSPDSTPFEMDEQEAVDVSVVSEHARPGKPRLDKVIADEVQASKGAIVVACCGPTSLNVMVRKIVASQIDPGRIRRGDMRGSISLVSEEFQY